LAVSLFVALVLPGAGHGEDYALVSNIYGAGGHVTFGDQGEVAVSPVPEVTNPTSFLTQSSYGIGLGDFDNDGLVDYLVGGIAWDAEAEVPFPAVEFHAKLGPGNDFAAGVVSELPEDWLITEGADFAVRSFAVADFDEDGNLDFVTSTGHYASHFSGNGDGTFEPVAQYRLGRIQGTMWADQTCFGLDAEDVNGDGHADAVCLRYQDNYNRGIRLIVFLGDGQGGFALETHPVYTTVQTLPQVFLRPPADANEFAYNNFWGLALSDFDDDGFVDAVVTPYQAVHWDYNRVIFVKGNGDGTFGTADDDGDDSTFDLDPVFTALDPLPTEGPDTRRDSEYVGVDDADFDGDGNRDIILSLEQKKAVAVYFGNGDGTFDLAPQGEIPIAFSQPWPGNLAEGVGTLPYCVVGDTTPPEVTLAEVPATTNQPNLSVSGVVSDDHALESLGILVNGVEVAGSLPWGEDGSFGATIPLEPGLNAIVAEATDAAGNVGTATVETLLDTEGPDVSLSEPVDAAEVSDLVDITCSASDALSSVSLLQLSVDGAVLGSWADTTSGAVQFDTETVLDGALEVECTAWDAAGNEGQANAVVFVRNWALALTPKTLNVDSRGRESVTLLVEGENVAILLPLAQWDLNLVVDGGDPVPVALDFAGSQGVGDADGDGVPDVKLKFDRQGLVAAVLAAVGNGEVVPDAPLGVEFRAGEDLLGTVEIRVLW